jgi:hypothetical protein
MYGKALLFKTFGVQEKEVFTNYQLVSPDITLDQVVEIFEHSTLNSSR